MVDQVDLVDHFDHCPIAFFIRHLTIVRAILFTIDLIDYAEKLLEQIDREIGNYHRLLRMFRRLFICISKWRYVLTWDNYSFFYKDVFGLYLADALCDGFGSYMLTIMIGVVMY